MCENKYRFFSCPDKCVMCANTIYNISVFCWISPNFDSHRLRNKDENFSVVIAGTRPRTNELSSTIWPKFKFILAWMWWIPCSHKSSVKYKWRIKVTNWCPHYSIFAIIECEWNKASLFDGLAYVFYAEKIPFTLCRLKGENWTDVLTNTVPHCNQLNEINEFKTTKLPTQSRLWLGRNKCLPFSIQFRKIQFTVDNLKISSGIHCKAIKIQTLQTE